MPASATSLTSDNRPHPGFRPGLVFKDGKLLEFTRHSLTVMRPWPEPLAWRRTTRKPFRPMRPLIRLIEDGQQVGQPEDSVASPNPIRQFLASVPLEVFETLRQFPSRQWHVMVLLARCPGAIDLAQSTPALAFALASNWVFARKLPTQPLRAARARIRLQQTDICDWLGFPGRRSTVKILRKLRSEDVSVETLLYLRDCLWDEKVSAVLRHCPRLTKEVVWLTSHPVWRHRILPKVIIEASQANNPRADHESPRDMLQFLQSLGLHRATPRLVFRSMEQITQYRCAWDPRTGALENTATRSCPTAPFPSPPFPSTESILPLTTVQELIDEGKEMHHCVGTLANRVMDGHSYYYRVLSPARATLEVQRRGSSWHLGALSGPCNSAVGAVVYGAVYGWLAYNLSLGYQVDDGKIAETERERPQEDEGGPTGRR